MFMFRIILLYFCSSLSTVGPIVFLPFLSPRFLLYRGFFTRGFSLRFLYRFFVYKRQGLVSIHRTRRFMCRAVRFQQSIYRRVPLR